MSETFLGILYLEIRFVSYDILIARWCKNNSVIVMFNDPSRSLTRHWCFTVHSVCADVLVPPLLPTPLLTAVFLKSR